MTQVIANGDTVDKDIVKEDDYKAAKEWPEDSVHCCLKRGRRVTQAERHNFELKVPMVGSKSCLGNVLRLHAYLVIPLQQVQFGETTRTSELVQELINSGNGKTILDR